MNQAKFEGKLERILGPNKQSFKQNTHKSPTNGDTTSNVIGAGNDFALN